MVTVLVMVGFLCFSTIATADDNDKLKFYGFAAFTVPVDGQENHEFKWVRLGVKAYPSDPMEIVFEYDIAKSDMKFAFVRGHRELGSVEYSLLVGKFFSPVAYFYSGPRAIRLTRWPTTLSGYSVCQTGLSVWAKGDDWTARIGHSETVTTALTYHGFSLFWEEGIGQGAIVKAFARGRWLHPYIGYSDSEEKVVFVQNYFQFQHNLRLYFQADFGDETDYLAGVNWEYAENSFAKLFYDTADDELHAEITFAFSF